MHEGRLWRLGRLGWVGLAFAVLTGCQPPAVPDPPTLRVSAIPDQAPERVRQQHAALIERVCAMAGVPCQWVPAENYDTLVDRFGRGEVDLAYFGAVTFVQAHHRHQAVPVAMRDIDFRFTSVIVVRRDDPATGLGDLQRRPFAFGNRHSTSGHFMARHMLGREGLVPERDFAEVFYSGNHDATIEAVAGGRVDAGAVNATVYYQRFVAGHPAASAVRVLWQTPPYADYVWALRPQLSAGLRERLADAFLDLGRPEDREALEREGAAGFVPAFPEDFDEVRDVVRAQGQL
jgi:phosphonate transport system substrate-binding protein